MLFLTRALLISLLILSVHASAQSTAFDALNIDGGSGKTPVADVGSFIQIAAQLKKLGPIALFHQDDSGNATISITPVLKQHSGSSSQVLDDGSATREFTTLESAFNYVDIIQKDASRVAAIDWTVSGAFHRGATQYGYRAIYQQIQNGQYVVTDVRIYLL
jgi:hypothetical protein